MSYIGQGLPADVFAGFTIDKFTGTGVASQTLTLTKAPLGETALLVTIDGVVQEPTDDFTVSGTTVTIVGTAPLNSEINVTHLSGTVPSTLASKVDVNGVSDAIILDADADTTISADTDDQIDFKLGASDIATLTTSSLTLKNSATADNSTFTLNLQTAESDIAADDVIGKIAFAAPNEGTGTDANLTAAAVQAVSEGDFSASSNASSLVFMTGSSAAATEVARFTSNGALLINTTNDGPASSVGGSGAYKKSLIIQDDVVGGTIYLGSNGSGDSSMLGGLHFFNSNNADEDASDADGQLVAFMRCRSVTSDNNAGDDSGAFVQFANSPEAGSLVETMRIAATKIEMFMGTFGSGVSASNSGFEVHDNTNNPFIQLAGTSTTTATKFNFLNGNGEVGKISTNGSATTYATSSDYRLKENVVTDWDATTRLKQLKPSRFNFKVDAGTTVDGFLAHEVSGIVPEAITGNKDETETKTKVVVHANGHVLAEGVEEANWTAGKVADEDGNIKYPSDSTWEASKVVPVYQAIDQSKLVPLLVKTVQELEARIKTLEDS
jgi:hypothetical protein